MSENLLNFGDKKINKKDFYNNKKQFNIKNIDINSSIYTINYLRSSYKKKKNTIYYKG